MILLNISSELNYKDFENDILDIFVTRNIECQIIQTKSVVKCNKKKGIIENGFMIKIFNIEPLEFKELIWVKLKKLMNLNCAFIKYREEYSGCILNWPGIFTPSKCNNCD